MRAGFSALHDSAIGLPTVRLPHVSSREGFPGQAFFDAVYTGDAPWDIGAAQPDLLDLIEAFPPHGRVVDLGCGTGDLVIALAARGHDVLGLDFAAAAIAEAEWRLQVEPPEVRARAELRVGDALRPSLLAGEIGSAVDSGFFHLFDAETRVQLVHELGRALPVGGRYYMLGFAIAIPAPDVPRQVTTEELGALFSEEAGWKVLDLRDAAFRTRGFDDIPSLALCAERTRRW
jgi:SAM-dependent methyltransferase